MSKLHIITPVKDSLDMTLQTINSIMDSEISIDFNYTVYNDFSSETTAEILEKKSKESGFTLVNLKDITMHPSPNYLFILRDAQQRAIFENAHLVIIEPDVIVEKNTIQQMYNYVSSLEKAGMIAALTTDMNGKINFPYLYAKKFSKGVLKTRKGLGFCCTLLTESFLASYNFDMLNPEKDWYDVFISHKSIELGFNNYLLTSLPVIHKHQGNRPPKHLKYIYPLRILLGKS
ncbi:MAG: glycosyltransferase family 2 protein [Bacteroidota bacterium]|nr:glycosyltransferase family 2 protein [Bacteroidota bacterium]